MHRNNCNTGLLWGLLEMYGNVGVVVMVCVCVRQTNFRLGITNEFKAGNTPFRPYNILIVKMVQCVLRWYFCR